MKKKKKKKRKKKKEKEGDKKKKKKKRKRLKQIFTNNTKNQIKKYFTVNKTSLYQSK